MTKANNKNGDAKQQSDVAVLTNLSHLGNYCRLRKMGKEMLARLPEGSKERSVVVDILQRTEPNPLVFWIGFGSVLAALAITVWLAY